MIRAFILGGRVRRPLTVGGVCLVGSLALAAAASAATYRVTTRADSSDGSCTASKCSLRDAMTQVNTDPGTSDTIVLPAGTYTLSGTELPAITNSSVNLTIAGAGTRTTTISGNAASRIFEIDDGTVSISGVTVTDGFFVANTSGPGEGGGAIYDGATLALTDVAVTDSVLEGDGNGGGGIDNQAGHLTLNQVTVSGNRTDGDGGGVFMDTASTNTFTDTTIADNTVNATLADTPSNYAEYGGGVEIDDGALRLTNTTIADNTLSRSGAVGSGDGLDDLYATVRSLNSIVAENYPTDCGQGRPTSTGPNLDSDSTCFTGSSALHADPKLGALADNGGQTDTLALSPGSPAVEHGQNAGCPAVDQRGVTRPQGAKCDLGAYEVKAAAPSVASGPASAVSKHAATLHGTVNPDKRATTVYFEYGTSASYGKRTPSQSVGSSYAIYEISRTLTGLAPGTKYHFRLVAVNALGTKDGVGETFTTPGKRS